MEFYAFAEGKSQAQAILAVLVAFTEEGLDVEFSIKGKKRLIHGHTQNGIVNLGVGLVEVHIRQVRGHRGTIRASSLRSGRSRIAQQAKQNETYCQTEPYSPQGNPSAETFLSIHRHYLISPFTGIGKRKKGCGLPT